MKKIYKSLVFTMATIALTLCVNDWLDLTPSDSIPSNSAITNYNDAKPLCMVCMMVCRETLPIHSIMPHVYVLLW